jgi:hypothetical protein
VTPAYLCHRALGGAWRTTNIGAIGRVDGLTVSVAPDGPIMWQAVATSGDQRVRLQRATPQAAARAALGELSRIVTDGCTGAPSE